MSNENYKTIIQDSTPPRLAVRTYAALPGRCYEVLKRSFRFLKFISKLLFRAFRRRSRDEPGFSSFPSTEGRGLRHKIAAIGAGFACGLHYVSSPVIFGQLVPISFWSWLIERFISRPSVDWRVLFDHSIREIPLVWIDGNHTHGLSARNRTSVNVYLKRLVSQKGFIPYQVSGAANDSTDCDGSRYYYGQKDLKIPYKNDVITDRHVLLFCDVDYHANMNEYLKYGQPLIMYTFYPSVPGATRKEYSFNIKDDLVYYNVKGGSGYSHRLWNYNGDTIAVLDKDNAMLTYDVCMKELTGDEDHRIIGLYPASKIPFPFWCHLDCPIGIQYRKITYGDYNVMRSNGEVSISPTGIASSYTIPEELYGSLEIRGENKTNTSLTVADIERHLNVAGLEKTSVSASHILRCLQFLQFGDLKNIPESPVTTSIPMSYQTLRPLVNEDGKETCALLCSPLVTFPSVFPVRSYNNDVATIAGRVDKMRNAMWPDRRYERFADEFIKLIVRTDAVGTGVPLSVHQVNDIQNKATQRARTRMVEAQLSTEPQNNLTCFIKSEPYAHFNDPRNITTMHASVTVMMSCFTYAFKQQCLKHLWWYAPGKNPKELIDVMATVVVDGTVCSDFSRMDGSISAFLQAKVVYACYMRWIHDNYKVELDKHFTSVFKRSAITREGYRYDPGYGTRSGSPITTDGNTLILAYVCFSAFRLMGKEVNEAWNLLGLYQGDDAVNRRIKGFRDSFTVVCKELGLTVEVGETERSRPVPFLGRVFADPLTCYESIQDPRRTLSKLHITNNKQVSIQQAMYNKAAGYLVTDSMTPIIGSWSRKISELSGVCSVKGLNSSEEWRMTQSYPQTDPDICRELFKQELGIDEVILSEWESKILAVEDVNEFPVLWDNVRQAKLDVVFDGEILYNQATLRISKDTTSQKVTLWQTNPQPKDTQRFTSLSSMTTSNPPTTTQSSWRRPLTDGNYKPKHQSTNSQASSTRKPYRTVRRERQRSRKTGPQSPSLQNPSAMQ